MAPILLSSTPTLFHPVPPRFAENRGGGAHVGHKTMHSIGDDVAVLISPKDDALAIDAKLQHLFAAALARGLRRPLPFASRFDGLA